MTYYTPFKFQRFVRHINKIWKTFGIVQKSNKYNLPKKISNSKQSYKIWENKMVDSVENLHLGCFFDPRFRFGFIYRIDFV